MGQDRRTLRKLLSSYQFPEKTHHPRPIHLLVDGTYLGERVLGTNWCVVVFKDAETSEDLWWEFCDTETTSVYQEGRDTLERLGYTLLSVTGDGFSGIRTAFSGTPFQMCQVHMERLVMQGTTRKPKLEAGMVLLALIRTLHHSGRRTFMRRLNGYIQKYRDLLNEKSTVEHTGDWFWTHENLRRACLSLQRLAGYLFTFEKDLTIPTTTNALEGQFSHIKDLLRIHRGASRAQQQKIIATILLESTIAPEEKKG
jgi:hypothetical protein